MLDGSILFCNYSMNMIIGITGTDGAGKGTVVDYLVTQKKFKHYSARSLIIKEIEVRSLPVDREHMRLVGNDLRREFGNDFIVKKGLEAAASDGVSNAVIESLRAMAEVETLKANQGVLLAVDAEQKLRYERIVDRQSESDRVTYEEFVAQEQLEMDDPDPNGMQKAKVLQAADYTIYNEGSLEELHNQIEEVLGKIASMS